MRDGTTHRERTKAHRNAIARFDQTAFESVAAKEKARRKILAAATRHGTLVAKDDEIAKRAESLKGVRTKRGMRGGKKVIHERSTSARRKTAARPQEIAVGAPSRTTRDDVAR